MVASISALSEKPPLALRAWLEDAGSFMQRLRQCHLQPQVLLLKQGFCFPTEEERERLEIRPRRVIFVREVEIREEQGPLMFARTVIPMATLHGRERRLAQLGTRSLGSVLFTYPKLQRSAFEISACQFSHYSSTCLWQRQSLFYLKGKTLLLREVFLPRLIYFIHSL